MGTRMGHRTLPSSSPDYGPFEKRRVGPVIAIKLFRGGEWRMIDLGTLSLPFWAPKSELVVKKIVYDSVDRFANARSHLFCRGFCSGTNRSWAATCDPRTGRDGCCRGSLPSPPTLESLFTRPIIVRRNIMYRKRSRRRMVYVFSSTWTAMPPTFLFPRPSPKFLSLLRNRAAVDRSGIYRRS